MIAIKDMEELPENCAKCRVRHECKVADEWDDFDWNYNARCEGCPLVEIVTCEDCKFWDKEKRFCPVIKCNTVKDFYCTQGKEKIDESNN